MATPASAQDVPLRGSMMVFGHDQDWPVSETGFDEPYDILTQDKGRPVDTFAPPTRPSRTGNKSGNGAEDSPLGAPDAMHGGPEDPETIGTARAAPVSGLDRPAAIVAQNRRVRAIEGLSRAREENPYAPLGLRLGRFVVTSTLEQGLGWTSNADSAPDATAATYSQTSLRLDALSDWSRHNGAFSAYGSYRRSLSGGDISEPEAGFDGRLQLDLGHQLRASTALAYDLRRESAASPVDLPPATSRPLRHLITGSAGLERRFGQFRLGLDGEIERQFFADAKLLDGGSHSQRQRNATLASMVLRGAYELSPALAPFVEVEVGRRINDLNRDANGYERSATRLGARVGLAFDLGEKLAGRVGAGWLRETIDDARLDDISGATIATEIRWSPVRGNQVGLSTATLVEGTTTPQESGSILYSGRIFAERELRANLSANAAFGAQWRDYAGSSAYDLTLRAEAGMTWWLNRYFGLTGRASHETVRSNLPGRDSKTASVFMGVRLQR